MVVPRLFLNRTALRLSDRSLFSLSGPPAKAPAMADVRKRSRVDPALFLSTGGDGSHRVCRRHARPPKGSARAFNAPTPYSLPSVLFRHVLFCTFRHALALPIGSRIQGRQALHPLPLTAGGVVNSEPFWERPAGTQTHSRRTGRKLGQVRYARQGLVRVPESNTKYGGRRGITGVNADPVIEPSISESSGIPKRKKFPILVSTGLPPQFTGHVFFATGGLRFKDSDCGAEILRSAMPGHR